MKYFIFVVIIGIVIITSCNNNSTNKKKNTEILISYFDDFTTQNPFDMNISLGKLIGTHIGDEFKQMADNLKGTQYIGSFMYEENKIVLFIYVFIKYNYIFHIICTNNNVVQNIQQFDCTGINDDITYYYNSTIRISTDLSEENIICIGVNDVTKSFILPKRAWGIDFSNYKLYEIPIDDLKVVVENN